MRRTCFLICLLICLSILSFSTARAFQPLVIADFSSNVGKNGVPFGWQLKERSGKADLSVIKDGDIHALRMRSENDSFAIQKRVNVSTLKYPVLSWKWKVIALPEGGDFRRSNTDDQAAQLFVAFASRKIIVYLWDTTAPQGLISDAWAPPFTKVKAIVVRSGPAETGKWLTETRNVYEDFKKLFGEEPPPITGIRLQINSQHTETKGESLFADVMFEPNL
jgi:Protein of unknown function (DUF3047)